MSAIDSSRALNAIGVATLIIDSFTPRGLTNVSENKQSFGELEQIIDALNAIETIMRKDAESGGLCGMRE